MSTTSIPGSHIPRLSCLHATIAMLSDIVSALQGEQVVYGTGLDKALTPAVPDDQIQCIQPR